MCSDLQDAPLHWLQRCCLQQCHPFVFAVSKEKVEEILTKDFEDIEEALEKVAEERMSMKLEEEDLQTLKEDVSEYKEVRGWLHERNVEGKELNT